MISRLLRLEVPTALACLALAGMVLFGAPAVAGGPSLGQRIAAAQATANDRALGSACAAISRMPLGGDSGFYWEIGDAGGIASDPATGLVAAGTVRPALTLVSGYTRSSSMLIASASKWVYGSYVAELHARQRGSTWSLPAAEVPFLNFTSGYDNMSGRCPAASTPTVQDCLDQTHGIGKSAVSNGALTPADVGRFDYNSGHLEVFEAGDAPAIAGVMNGANADDADLASAIMSILAAHGVKMNLSFITPLPAGGIETTPADYAAFLQGLLRKDDPLYMAHFLRPAQDDPYAVCTNPDDDDCAAVYTPTPQDVSWHYSVTHWIEDDPVSGDGAYSSPGKFGFYPWIDAGLDWYGIVARFDSTKALVKQEAPYYKSAVCGEAIRKAFMSGVPQD